MSALRDCVTNARPTTLLVAGYAFFLLLTWFLLSLPYAQKIEVSWLDGLFIATSVVSTTGLISVDPGTSYSIFGQAVILLVIQICGLGYMTFGSLILIALREKMSKASLKSSLKVNRTDLPLPSDFRTSSFINKVIVFTLSAEALGAFVLYIYFKDAGETAPFWFAVFHSVSAFCTAGFSLMSSNFVEYQSHTGITLVLSALSILGGIGFIVIVDLWSVIKDRSKSLHFTSQIILKVTIGSLVVGTLFVAFADGNIADMSSKDRWLTAFFQVMSASSTVGFNTYVIADLNIAVIFVLYFLMLFGSAPSGTGGGLRSTTLAALIGIVRSTLKRRDKILVDDKQLPLEKLQLATSTFIFAAMIIFVTVTLLLLTESAPMSWIIFEVLSALGTVGLSMGLTTELSPVGKFAIIAMMFIGRVGILTFGMFMSFQEPSSESKEEADVVI